MKKQNQFLSALCLVLALVGLPVMQTVKTCHQARRAVAVSKAKRFIGFFTTDGSSSQTSNDGLLPVRCHHISNSGFGDLIGSSEFALIRVSRSFSYSGRLESFVLSRQHSVPFRPPSLRS